MKLKCEICGCEFVYPYEINLHRHPEYELNGVPCNFWNLIDYDTDFSIDVDYEAQGIFRYSKAFPMGRKLQKYSLNEGNTPLKRYKENVYIKDETVNPTGSFKDRGMPLLMNEVLWHGKKAIAIASTGNAAISLISYAKRYRLQSIVFVPETISEIKKRQLSKADKIVYSADLVESFEDFMQFCVNNNKVFNGFLSTNQSYLCGLKTIYYEIFHQLGNMAPNYVIIPCASGGNTIACHMAWNDMKRHGLIDAIPKIIIVQIKGGNPLEEGYSKGVRDSLYIIEEPKESKTILSTDTCFNYFKIYNMLENDEVIPISITDYEIDMLVEQQRNWKYDYTSLSVFAAYNRIKHMVKKSEKIVLVVTAKAK